MLFNYLSYELEFGNKQAGIQACRTVLLNLRTLKSINLRDLQQFVLPADLGIKTSGDLLFFVSVNADQGSYL